MSSGRTCGRTFSLVSIPRIGIFFLQTTFLSLKDAINNALICFLLYIVGKLRAYVGPLYSSSCMFSVLILLSKQVLIISGKILEFFLTLTVALLFN